MFKDITLFDVLVCWTIVGISLAVILLALLIGCSFILYAISALVESGVI